jgi:FixJ family two-component response regulator
MQKIPLLILTARAEDLGELTELLAESPWELTSVPQLEDAAVALKSATAPILLFDRDTAGASWRETVKRLVKSRRQACVVLLSNVSDQYLWDEVVQQGGFDLLTRPFRKEQVLSTLVFAYAHCRTPWPKAVS